jgi:hypothetical protein
MAGDALLAVHQHDADLVGREGASDGRRETGEDQKPKQRRAGPRTTAK